ncbi:MAG: phosphate acyltransferase PlsX, partial [Eubacterium sp.]|nr:phosphate acyltransferase PlsX [Eubacterium sp.]
MSATDVVRVVVDAMGGDYAPAEPVKGAVDALKENERLRIILVGKPEMIRQELAKYQYDETRMEIVPAEDIIETAEAPVQAIRQKKDSSLVVGLTLLKEGRADAFVSSGNTGAVLAGGQLIVRRIKGVQRAPLAPLIPTEKGPKLLIDCGANVDARATQLVQFAHIGSIYMESVMGVRNPRVALVNIGAEEEKGNALAKETYPLLAASENINFVGNIEARDIPKGDADVIVTEAFTGNVILKMYEGVG